MEMIVICEDCLKKQLYKVDQVERIFCTMTNGQINQVVEYALRNLLDKR